MSENINKRPSKSILKTSTSIERQDHPSSSKKPKEQRFDEMNIIATLHPPDKDYGHMKIEEPKTPYSEYSDPDLNPTRDEIDANILAAKLAAGMNKPPREYSSSSDEEFHETPQEKIIRIEFEEKRKNHYNEFQAIRLARKLMEEEEEDDSPCDKTAMDIAEASPNSAASTSPTEDQPGSAKVKSAPKKSDP